jgi:excisionase family DNA binding protein
VKILYMQEIQEQLGSSKDTVLRLIKSGKLKAFKIGGRNATTEELLNDYINNQIAEAENERNK